MGLYSYKAYNKEGLRVEGAIEARDEAALKASLKAEGLVPIKIVTSSGQKPSQSLFKIRKGVGLSDLEFFSSEISILLRNGIKIDRALDIVRSGIKEESFRSIIEAIYKETRQGVPLSQAVSTRSDIFDPLYASVIAIGEKTGRLADAFADLEATLKFRKHVASKIKQAVFYPAFILVFCVLALLFIFNFIIPKFSVLFETPGSIPAYTQVLLEVSAFIRSYQLFLLAGLVGLCLYGVKAMRSSSVRPVVDLIVYRMPVVSSLVLTLENLRFCSALKILLKNSVVIDEALGYAVSAVGNRYIKRRIRFLQEDIKKGKELSDLLASTQFIPPSFISLIEVGEHSGNLDEIFAELEERFRIQFENNIMQFTSLLEPVLILGMGLIVGSIVIMMLMSIVSIQDIKV